MVRIELLYRSKDRGEFSIENVFANVAPYITHNSYEIRNVFLPCGRYNTLKNLFTNIRFAKNLTGNVVHITGEANFLAIFLNKKKVILTIHDLISLEMNKGIKKQLYKLFWLYLPFLYADKITCVSVKTYKEVIGMCPLVKKKTCVIPDSYNDMFEISPKHFNDINPVILVIGTRFNKNLERIIKAVRNITCVLHIIGKMTEEQKDLLEQCGTTYKNDYNVSDEEIFNCYKECDIVCFASLYEGFGMPIIEAQAVGRAVVTSNISPMYEVAGKGAELVDPFCVDSIRKGILNVINCKELREKIITEGFKNADKYSSKIVGEMYKSLYINISKNS